MPRGRRPKAAPLGSEVVIVDSEGFPRPKSTVKKKKKSPNSQQGVNLPELIPPPPHQVAHPPHNHHTINLHNPFEDIPPGQMMQPNKQVMPPGTKIYPSHQQMVFNPSNPNAPPIYPCGICHKEIHESDQAIPCESGCNFWFHRVCTGLTEPAYQMLIQEPFAEWVCDKCWQTKNIPIIKLKT